MESEVTGLVFLLKRMENFDALIDWPDQEQYLPKQDLKQVVSLTEVGHQQKEGDELHNNFWKSWG